MNLSVSNLSFTYREHNVLQNIEVSAGPGEITGIVGPNGSGKSTLLRSLAGLLETEETISYNNQFIEAISFRDRARLFAFVAQNELNEFPYDVIEIVRMGLAYKSTSFSTALGPNDESQINAVLEEFDLLPMSHRSIQSLSGGEWQRVMLARAFVQQADLLILDEPTSALDLKHQGALMDSLHRRAKEGGSALLSLHDLNLAAAGCDRIFLLDDGKVAASGAPEDVLTQANIERVYQARVQVGKDSNGEPYIHLDSQGWKSP